MPSPRVTAFLSDFTLGFSDGLTVPFALTAGLSSLGRTDTVIYAGLAELCAGCISMGIGGYLSARDAARGDSRDASKDSSRTEEELGMLETPRGSEDEVELGEKPHDMMQQRLMALDLPDEAFQAVLEIFESELDETKRLSHRRDRSHNERVEGTGMRYGAVWSGLSISLGYIVGGLLPLLPYCFAGNVGNGLRWSAVLCLIALFLYGAVKDRVLGDGKRSTWRSVGEGVRMVLLGAMAAGAAVLCVYLVNQGVA